MTQPNAPVAAPGRVIRDGDTSFATDSHIFLSVHQALRNSPTSSHVLWTPDINEELPIKMSRTGIGAAPPVTLIEAFTETVRKHGNKPALAYKPPALKEGKFRVFDWQHYWNENCRFAKALMSIGHQPRDRVIIMGAGSAFWHIAHFGTIFANGISGSIYPTNGTEATRFIIEQSECVVAVVDTVENLEKVLAAKQSGQCPKIKHIVMYMEDPPEGPGYQSVWRWADFVRLGHSISDSLLTERMDCQTPGMCCELVYTSGTTGLPKAVMLSHDNCLWTTFSLLQMVHFSSDERVVSFLPLSHIAPQIIDIYIPILSGCCTYFAQPDALRGSLIVTLLEVRPTFLFAVPRVYEKMEERIRAIGAQSSGLKKKFSDWVKSVGLQGTTAQLRGEQPPFMYNIVKATILKKIRTALGLDQCKAIASGAAPLQPTTQEYFLSLGMAINDMYGMSESTGPQTSNAAWPGWFKSQTAGVSLPGTEIMISNPSAEGLGEVCYRGRNIFMGYYKNPEATRDTIDADGFLHSGDVGYVDEDGFLNITGRLKELLVTAGGENVAPVPIENVIKEEMPWISNCMVVGDKRKFLTLLVCLRSVPDSEGNPTNSLDTSMTEVLAARGSSTKTVFDAATDNAVKELIGEGIERANKRAISRAQKIVRFRVIPQDFTQAGGELTPTLKLKRNIVLEKYASSIEGMYAETESDASTSSSYGDDEDTRMKPKTLSARL